MPTLITNQLDVPKASTPDLLYTYNELTGKNITRFASRSAAEQQVSNAILAAEYRDGHNGIQKGAKAKARPARDYEDEMPAITDPPTTTPEAPMATKGTKKAKRAKTTTTTKVTKRERAPRDSVKNAVVEATGNGTTKLQANSDRAKALDIITRHTTGIAVSKLGEKMERDARGFVQKLIEMGHVRLRKE